MAVQEYDVKMDDRHEQQEATPGGVRKKPWGQKLKPQVYEFDARLGSFCLRNFFLSVDISTAALVSYVTRY
jgi:hypothetical protein